MQFNDTTSPVKGQRLTLTERIEIQTWKRLDKSNWFIAKELGRSHSTINDEVKRGTAIQKMLINGKALFLEVYYAETGQIIYEKHREASKPRYKFLKVERFIQYTKQKIQEEKWSPDIVVDQAIELSTYEPHERVCAKTLHTYIDAGLMDLNMLDL